MLAPVSGQVVDTWCRHQVFLWGDLFVACGRCCTLAGPQSNDLVPVGLSGAEGPNKRYESSQWALSTILDGKHLRELMRQRNSVNTIFKVHVTNKESARN